MQASVGVPHDLLVKIVILLELDQVATVGFVCKALRAASIACVTSLHFCSKWWPDPREMLSQRLQVFTSVKRLSLISLTADHAHLLQLPGVLPRLCHLVLASSEKPWANVEAIIAAMPFATQLTKLNLGDAIIGNVARLAPGLSLCPSLAELEVAWHWTEHAELVEATPRAPGLSVIYANWGGGGLPGELSLLTGMRRLEILELEAPADMEAVAAITLLTRLEIWGWRDRMPELVSLSKLAALQELSIGRCCPVSRLGDLPRIVAPMSHLRELEVLGDVWVPGTVGAVLASLPALTNLNMGSDLRFADLTGPIRGLSEGSAS
jgi:hypothetical protein